MKRRFSRAVAAVAILAMLVAPSFAVGPGDGPPVPGGEPPSVVPPVTTPPVTTPPDTPSNVPEINPGAAVGALVLLIGGALLLTGRRRPVPLTNRID